MAGLNECISWLLEFFVHWDMLINVWMQEIQRPLLIKIMIVITYMGFPLTYLFITSLLCIYLLAIAERHPLIIETVFLNSCLLSTWAIMELLKHIFERSRPAGEALTAASGFSFPSGHAMVSLAFYGYIVYLLKRYDKNWGRIGAWVLYPLILLIGLSRVYLNVHYTSDVLAGFVFGAICLAANLIALNITRKYIESRKVE